jgi:hypothetical protein
MADIAWAAELALSRESVPQIETGGYADERVDLWTAAHEPQAHSPGM